MVLAFARQIQIAISIKVSCNKVVMGGGRWSNGCHKGSIAVSQENGDAAFRASTIVTGTICQVHIPVCVQIAQHEAGCHTIAKGGNWHKRAFCLCEFAVPVAQKDRHPGDTCDCEVQLPV